MAALLMLCDLGFDAEVVDLAGTSVPPNRLLSLMVDRLGEYGSICSG